MIGEIFSGNFSAVPVLFCSRSHVTATTESASKHHRWDGSQDVRV